MQFKGRLLLPDEPGPGLQVNLDVAEHHLAVESETGELGAWPLETVDVRRLSGDVFAMTVAGEVLHFVADDTISFAYSGVPAVERVSRSRTRSSFRNLLDRIWSEPPEAEPETLEPPAGQPFEEPATMSRLEQAHDERHPPTRPPLRDPNEPGDDVVLEDPASTAEPAGDPSPTGAGWTRPGHLIDDPITDVGDEAPSGEKSPALSDIPWAGEVDASRESREERQVCPAVRSDGRPCRARIITASGYCYAHDPDRLAEEGYRSAQEARARLRRRETSRLNRVYRRLEKAMRQVERGELDPQIASAMAQLAHTMCAILDLGAEEDDDVETA